jgi:hypothetical protein
MKTLAKFVVSVALIVLLAYMSVYGLTNAAA